MQARTRRWDIAPSGRDDWDNRVYGNYRPAPFDGANAFSAAAQAEMVPSPASRRRRVDQAPARPPNPGYTPLELYKP